MDQSTLDEWLPPPVDPETRAHIYSLANALGGPSIENEGRYCPGDDALACLKDLRRWIRAFELKFNRRLDAVRCIAEANIVKGDLLEIIALWTPNSSIEGLKGRLALACLEVLVPLTWPIEIEDDQMRVSHHRHLPYVRLAQAGYKRAILQHDSGRILNTAVRLALPSLALPRRERTLKDEGIIRIVLYFLRNVVLLTQPQDLPADADEGDISRAATLDAFHQQDVFKLLLTMSSSMGEDFAMQDVIVLEILFHLLKGVDPEKLFVEEKKLTSANTEELKDLIQKEKAMLAGYTRYAPTRHNRFGTMIWVKRDDEKMSTVSGQDVLGNQQQSLMKMDKTKKWNKRKAVRRNQDEELLQNEFDREVPLHSTARKQLRSFVEDCLDSSFNPLFMFLRKTIEREAERVLQSHYMQYFYLIHWFLKAECARRKQSKQKAEKQDHKNLSAQEIDESFALIAGVMNQETFILLNRSMQKSLDDKAWVELNSEMKCFTQILITVQEMADSAIEDDQDIAENIQNRIFYEESTHDRVLTILRSYKDQGFGYLDACTELSHVFLRMLERYSKQNVDLQVRTRRRARRKRKAEPQTQREEDGAEDQESGDDVVEAQRVTSERKFDFARFCARFVSQPCINTFAAFTRYYKDLNPEQLKRAHRYFYRVAFKMEFGVVLYRVDILMLLHKMIQGPNGLDKELPTFKEWEELVKQIFKRCIRKAQERPELVVEMLFSKIPNTIYYLEHGHDKEMKRTPRAPAELEVKPGFDKSGQIGVAVSVLINQNKSDAVEWVKSVLKKAVEERESWEGLEAARRNDTENATSAEDGSVVPTTEQEERKPPSIVVSPDNEERRVQMFKDNKLRLLLTLVGCERLGLSEDPDATWIIPSDTSIDVLKEGFDAAQKHTFDPPTYEDDKNAEDFLRSKSAAQRRRAEVDENSDDEGENEWNGEEDFLFPAGGPTSRRPDTGDEEGKPKRRRLKQREARELDDDEKARRAEARRKADDEKRKKIKSDLFVHDSDEETDDEKDKEFFAKEEEIRKNAGRTIAMEMAKAQIGGEVEKGKRRKRKAVAGEASRSKGTKRRKSLFDPDSDDSDLELSSDDDNPLKGTGLSALLEDDSDEDSDTRRQPIEISSASSSDDDNESIDGDSDKEVQTDTPLSSQLHGASRSDHESGAENATSKALGKTTAPDVKMADAATDDDEEDAPIRKAAVRRSNTRGGFIVDSDSE